jgi:hypothetical protein
LNGSFDIANALDGNTVLVIAIDELIFKFTNFVDQDAELIRNIRNVIVAGFTPDGQLLLVLRSALNPQKQGTPSRFDVQRLPFSLDQPVPYFA